jgi:membrane-bound lytic murein transglycosylase A
MAGIRAWLHAHPDRAADVMNANERYIFFRLVEGEGPVGSQGVALTPGRSLAVDARHLPLGAPVWLETEDPLVAGRPYRRLMVAQDTGNAIRGAVRGDVFFGSGPAAGRMAGAMNRAGRLYLLVPRVSVR